MNLVLSLLVGSAIVCCFVFPASIIIAVMRLERIARALESSNARAERESEAQAEKKEPQRFVETFIVDGEFLGDESFEEALDREIERRLGKDIQIHDVQTTFYKMPDGILSFHGAIRTVIYSHR